MYFSIIIPVYNIEKYLHKCIQSVLSQTCSDYELLLIDDGSTDGSGTICDEYAANNSNVYVFHQKNMGQSAARNCGIEMAKGKYLLFLDGDDYWYDPECLGKLLKYICEDNPGVDVVAYDAVYFINDDRKKERKYHCIHCLEESTQKGGGYTPEEFLVRHISLNRWYDWAPWLYAFSRKMFCDGGAQFPVGRKYEDFYLIWRVLLSAERIGVFPVTFYVHGKDRPGSTTYTVEYQFFDDYLWAIDENIKDVKKMEISSRLKHCLLSSFSMYYVNACARVFYLTGNNKEKMFKRVEKRKKYLKYAHGKQYELMRKGAKVIGFRNALRLLHLYSIFGRIIRHLS